MDIGGAVRRARRRIGLSQRQLAEKSGVPQSTVARIETGAVVPRVDTFERLLKACDRSLEVLPRLGIGIDRSLIREMLRLAPAERLRVAAKSAKNLAEFEAAVKR
jgi:transcriptional regulator with XRE-family HTH domain